MPKEPVVIEERCGVCVCIWRFAHRESYLSLVKKLMAHIESMKGEKHDAELNGFNGRSKGIQPKEVEAVKQAGSSRRRSDMFIAPSFNGEVLVRRSGQTSTSSYFGLSAPPNKAGGGRLRVSINMLPLWGKASPIK